MTFEFVKGKIPQNLYDEQEENMYSYLTIEVVNSGKPQFCSKEVMF